MENKCCMQCGSPMKGRRDKKFCDDHCRNNYNNLLHLNTTSMMRKVHQVLRKNRRILEKALAKAKQSDRIPLDSLLEEGFLPIYHTKSGSDEQGRSYFFCYEYGFQLHEQFVHIFVVPEARAA